MNSQIKQISKDFYAAVERDEDITGLAVVANVKTGDTNVTGGGTAKQYARLFMAVPVHLELYFREIGGKEYDARRQNYIYSRVKEFLEEIP